MDGMIEIDAMRLPGDGKVLVRVDDRWFLSDKVVMEGDGLSKVRIEDKWFLANFREGVAG